MPMFVVRVKNRNNTSKYFLHESESILELRVILESKGYESMKLYEAVFNGKGKLFDVKDNTGFLLGSFGADILRAMAVEGEITPNHSLLVTDKSGRQEWIAAWKIDDLLPQNMALDGMQLSDASEVLSEGEMVKLRSIKHMLDNDIIDRSEYRRKMAEVLGLSCEPTRSC